MLPLNLIREKTDLVKQGVKSKREKIDIEQILNLDKEQRLLLNKLNEKRAQRNKTSEEIGKSRMRGENTDDAIKSMQILSSRR